MKNIGETRLMSKYTFNRKNQNSPYDTGKGLRRLMSAAGHRFFRTDSGTDSRTAPLPAFIASVFLLSSLLLPASVIPTSVMQVQAAESLRSALHGIRQCLWRATRFPNGPRDRLWLRNPLS